MAFKVESKTALNQLEAIVISISEPRLNLQSGRRDIKKCKQYYQHDERKKETKQI
jgi:hypothetical protein